MRCWICRRRFFATGKAHNRICLADACQVWRRGLEHIRERAKRGETCLFCKVPPMEGRRVCVRHQWRKDPCRTPGCTERVPYVDGQGNKRSYCPKCRPQLFRVPPASRRAPEPAAPEASP